MKKYKPFLYFVIFFISWLILISTLWQFPIFLLVILSILTIVYFIFFKKENDIKVYFVAAVFGPVGEAIVSSSGLWTYFGMTFFGIPIWLPLAWGITAISIFRLINALRLE